MCNIEILTTNLQSVPDFRKPQGRRYKLHNLLTIMILSMLSGSDDFEAMSLYCVKKAYFLRERGLLDDKNLPSHDLFRWILMHLDKSAFSHILCAWLESFDPSCDESALKDKRFIHIDGKVLRATRTCEHSRTGLLVLNAYCSNTHVTIGEMLVDKKSCEKTAIPLIINTLDLRNDIVTIDAAGTMTHVAAAIIGKKGDYILALKKNNKLFYNEVKSFFDNFSDTILIKDTAQSIDKQGLRTDIRKCSIITDLKYFPDAQDWKNLKTLIRIESQRTMNDKTTSEERFYLSSLQYDAAPLMDAIRRHWSIENNLHWHLDVAFNEDKLRLKQKNATLCMAVLRRFALALISKSESKESKKAQRLAIGWNDNELLKVLNVNNINFS
jgi:predicted transposase YbfD/YdcC